MSDVEPASALRRLAARLQGVADGVGLELRQFFPVVVPGDDGPLIVNAVFTLKENTPQPRPDGETQEAIDDQFRRLADQLAQDAADTEQRELERRLAELQEKMNRPPGTT